MCGVLRKELGRVMGKASGLGFEVCLIFKEFFKMLFQGLDCTHRMFILEHICFSKSSYEADLRLT